MNNIKDGGPAFPLRGVSDGEMQSDRRFGMSLRDWFAGQALVHTAGDGVTMSQVVGSGDRRSQAENLALWCYDIADALIAERERI